MLADKPSGQRIPGYCALCVSRCGSIAVVENGRFVALEPDPSHPTGKALCAKGRAAPELVYHSDRLLYPLKRTRPKGDPDPGWVLPFMVVDNSTITPIRLTVPSDASYYQEAPSFSHYKRRGLYDLSYLLVLARSLPSPFSGAVLASWLSLSSTFPLSSCIQAQPSPAPAQATLTSRLPCMSSCLHCLLGWRAGASACAPLA
jgi:Molybdopterin oxidoreductase Fe4S4 domain